MKHHLLTSIGAAMLLLSSSCEKVSYSPDSNLYGKWGNAAEVYEFRNDETFSQLIHRKAPIVTIKDTLTIVKDTADADSIFGTYKVDSKNKDIVFDVKGYRKRLTRTVVNTGGLKAPDWSYSIVADTLKYESLVQINRLVKRP